MNAYCVPGTMYAKCFNIVSCLSLVKTHELSTVIFYCTVKKIGFTEVKKCTKTTQLIND